MTQRQMAIVINKYDAGSEPSDFVYWQSRPAIERIQALETIRREYILWKYGTFPRLQRVHRVIEVGQHVINA